MALRRFEFTSESSNKFWQIDTETGEASWGRIGTSGQSKTYDGHEIAGKIAEKLGKGYVEVGRRHPGLEMADRDLAEARRKSRAEKVAPNFMSELRKIK